MAEARGLHVALVTTDGHVVVAGGLAVGHPTASVELWDPGTNGFSAGRPLTIARSGATLTRLADGTALLAGGVDANDAYLSSIELIVPSAS